MARKSEPFSMRLSERMDQFVTAEARRTRRSKGAVVESLAEEALRMRRFPGIAFRGAGWDRRAWVMGTALDVWEIVGQLRAFGSLEEATAATHLSEQQLELAVAYHREFPDEIDQMIAENERPLDELQREFPTFETIVLD
jgi:hypothetical protein